MESGIKSTLEEFGIIQPGKLTQTAAQKSDEQGHSRGPDQVAASAGPVTGILQAVNKEMKRQKQSGTAPGDHNSQGVSPAKISQSVLTGRKGRLKARLKSKMQKLRIHRDLKMHLTHTLRESDRRFHECIRSIVSDGLEKQEQTLNQYVQKNIKERSCDQFDGRDHFLPSFCRPAHQYTSYKLSEDENIKLKIRVSGLLDQDLEMIFRVRDLQMASKAQLKSDRDNASAPKTREQLKEWEKEIEERQEAYVRSRFNRVDAVVDFLKVGWRQQLDLERKRQDDKENRDSNGGEADAEAETEGEDLVEDLQVEASVCFSPENLIQHFFLKNHQFTKTQLLFKKPNLHKLDLSNAPTLIQLVKMSDFTTSQGEINCMKTVLLFLDVQKVRAAEAYKLKRDPIENFWLEPILKSAEQSQKVNDPEAHLKQMKEQLQSQKQQVVEVIVNILQVITLNQGENELKEKIDKIGDAMKKMEKTVNTQQDTKEHQNIDCGGDLTTSSDEDESQREEEIQRLKDLVQQTMSTNEQPQIAETKPNNENALGKDKSRNQADPDRQQFSHFKFHPKDYNTASRSEIGETGRLYHHFYPQRGPPGAMLQRDLYGGSLYDNRLQNDSDYIRTPPPYHVGNERGKFGMHDDGQRVRFVDDSPNHLYRDPHHIGEDEHNNINNFEMNMNQASLPCHPIPLRQFNNPDEAQAVDEFHNDSMDQNSLLQIPTQHRDKKNEDDIHSGDLNHRTNVLEQQPLDHLHRHHPDDDLLEDIPASSVLPKKTIKKIVPTLLDRFIDPEPNQRFFNKSPPPYDNMHHFQQKQQRQSERTYSFADNQTNGGGQVEKQPSNNQQFNLMNSVLRNISPGPNPQFMSNQNNSYHPSSNQLLPSQTRIQFTDKPAPKLSSHANNNNNPLLTDIPKPDPAAAYQSRSPNHQSHSQGSAFRSYQRPPAAADASGCDVAVLPEGDQREEGARSNDSQAILQQLSQTRLVQRAAKEEQSQSTTRFKSFKDYFEKKRNEQAIENSERQTLTLGAAPGTIVGNNEQDRLSEDVLGQASKVVGGVDLEAINKDFQYQKRQQEILTAQARMDVDSRKIIQDHHSNESRKVNDGISKINQVDQLNVIESKLQPFKFENTHSIGPGGIMKSQLEQKIIDDGQSIGNNKNHNMAIGDDVSAGKPTGGTGNRDLFASNKRLNFSHINENVEGVGNISPNNVNSISFLNQHHHPSARLQQPSSFKDQQNDLFANKHDGATVLSNAVINDHAIGARNPPNHAGDDGHQNHEDHVSPKLRLGTGRLQTFDYVTTPKRHQQLSGNKHFGTKSDNGGRLPNYPNFNYYNGYDYNNDMSDFFDDNFQDMNGTYPYFIDEDDLQLNPLEDPLTGAIRNIQLRYMDEMQYHYKNNNNQNNSQLHSSFKNNRGPLSKYNQRRNVDESQFSQLRDNGPRRQYGGHGATLLSLVSPRQLRDDVDDDDRQSKAPSITDPVTSNRNVSGGQTIGIERSSLDKTQRRLGGGPLIPDSQSQNNHMDYQHEILIQDPLGREQDMGRSRGPAYQGDELFDKNKLPQSSLLNNRVSQYPFDPHHFGGAHDQQQQQSYPMNTAAGANEDMNHPTQSRKDAGSHPYMSSLPGISQAPAAMYNHQPATSTPYHQQYNQSLPKTLGGASISNSNYNTNTAKKRKQKLRMKQPHLRDNKNHSPSKLSPPSDISCIPGNKRLRGDIVDSADEDHAQVMLHASRDIMADKNMSKIYPHTSSLNPNLPQNHKSSHSGGIYTKSQHDHFNHNEAHSPHASSSASQDNFAMPHPSELFNEIQEQP